MLLRMGFVAAEGLAPQAAAVWPYDTYHDLRWLYVYHDSVMHFLLWLGLLVVARGLFHTILVMLAWPKQVHRPAMWWLVRRNLGVALLVAVLVSPWALLSVAASVVSLSWVLLASLLPMFLLAPFLQRATVVDPWWRGLPSKRLVGWSLLNFVVLTVAGAVCWIVPGWWMVLIAAAAGMVNGLLWKQVVKAALLVPRARFSSVPATPIVTVMALLAPLIVAVVVAVVPGRLVRTEALLLDRPLPNGVTHAVIVLAGHGTRYDGEQPPDLRVQRFSYRGLDAAGQPLPYQPADTTISITDSVALLRRQVDQLHQRTGRKIALIGESEGAMVARTYLARDPHPAVDSTALFSPLISAGRTYYPPPHHDQGWGVVTGWQLRAVFSLIDLAGGPGKSPDEPFIRSLIDDAPFYRSQMMCPVPGVRMVAFLPITTAAEAPPGEYTGIPVYQLLGVHGYLLDQSHVRDILVTFLAGEPIHHTRIEYPALQMLGAAWQAPPLLISVNPLWDHYTWPDPALTKDMCRPR
ncbi:esterase/lipase family protein [Micromonospora aurantiaca (nom. illeg.)]|uniref:esterase/lipase family protein n=1 Tax=Micromonospora aurantiaca (nom. illeg.) TaxID=47850 RepID=UPI0033E60B76